MPYLGVFLLILLGAEIFSVFLVAKLIGGGVTFLLMVAGWVAGAYILRGRNGAARTVMAAATARNAGRLSLYQMLWPLRIPMAGMLLLMPGFLSTLGAVLLLLPFKGKPVSGAGFGGGAGQQRGHDDDVIEGDFVVRGKSESARSSNIIEHK